MNFLSLIRQELIEHGYVGAVRELPIGKVLGIYCGDELMLVVETTETPTVLRCRDSWMANKYSDQAVTFDLAEPNSIKQLIDYVTRKTFLIYERIALAKSTR